MRFHIVKRDSCPFWKKLCLYLAAVAAALAQRAQGKPIREKD